MQSQILGCQRTRHRFLNARSPLVSGARHALGDYSTAVVGAVARCIVFIGALLASSQAHAVIRPTNFTGTDQRFEATIDLTGNVFADGNGSVVNTKAKIEPFIFKAPLNHSLNLFGGAIGLRSNPQTDPLGMTVDMSSKVQLLDMTNFDLDLFYGQSADFSIDTIFITTNSTVSLLKNISIDVSGTLGGLRFDQTGSATILGAAQSGTFSVQGNLTANIDNLVAVVFGLLQVPVDSQSVVLPGALTGTWAITGPASVPKFSLDGAINLDVPLSLLTNLTTAITDVLSLTISSTIDLSASLTLDAYYHLEDVYWEPEPGSFVLLGIGLAAVVGVAVHRRRGRR